VLAKSVYWSGRFLAGMLLLTGIIVTWTVGALRADTPGWTWFLAPFAGIAVGVVVHECGHLLACQALGAEVRGFHIGSPRKGALGLRFRFRGVPVSLGVPFAGQVEHAPMDSAWQRAAVMASGSLADLVVAGVLATVSLGLPSRPGQTITISLAIVSGAVGASNLLPFQTSRAGGLSDGARLLMLGNGRLASALRSHERAAAGRGTPWHHASPAEEAEFKADAAMANEVLKDPDARLPPELVAKWLSAFRARTFIGLGTAGATARALRREGRIEELAELLRDYPKPYRVTKTAMLDPVHCLAYEILLAPGISPEAADLAAERVEWAIKAHDSLPHDGNNRCSWRDAATHTMAVGLLRQGKPAMVENLCAPVLSSPELSAANRATVLATIALARQALGQPCGRPLSEAIALAPDADLVAEATRSACRSSSSSRPSPAGAPSTLPISSR
jgi:hypothetical protein